MASEVNVDEFALIRRYFHGLTPTAADVRLGIGDDCALMSVPSGFELAVSTDTLVAGRHFPLSTPAYDIGWKSLAVNLSDLAAMGATPRWFTLALSLQHADDQWLAQFSAGMRELALMHDTVLVGGDTTRGPLNINITVMGLVPDTQALRRSGARIGDLICVTGSLGDAALALRLMQQDQAEPDETLRTRLDRPQPRVRAGLAMRGLASAAIDLSDGLAGDLLHLLGASGVGAVIHTADLPTSAAFQRSCRPSERLALQHAGGDDYELCGCLPP
ncbi:MAG: thiamine-phosphate kinase, partial [Panacagrimonas sp.]